jgi:hypothetical protein
LSNNNYLLRHLGNAGVNLASAFVTLLFAAKPVIRVFAEWIDHLTKTIAQMSIAGKKSGALSDFFHKAADSMKQWGDILGNFGRV